MARGVLYPRWRLCYGPALLAFLACTVLFRIFSRYTPRRRLRASSRRRGPGPLLASCYDAFTLALLFSCTCIFGYVPVVVFGAAAFAHRVANFGTLQSPAVKQPTAIPPVVRMCLYDTSPLRLPVYSFRSNVSSPPVIPLPPQQVPKRTQRVRHLRRGKRLTHR